MQHENSASLNCVTSNSEIWKTEQDEKMQHEIVNVMQY